MLGIQSSWQDSSLHSVARHSKLQSHANGSKQTNSNIKQRINNNPNNNSSIISSIPHSMDDSKRSMTQSNKTSDSNNHSDLDLVSTVGSDTFRLVLSFLDIPSLLNAARVSKFWRTCSVSPTAHAIWRIHALRAVEPYIHFPLRHFNFASLMASAFPATLNLAQNGQFGKAEWPTDESAFALLKSYRANAARNIELGREKAIAAIAAEKEPGVQQKLTSLRQRLAFFTHSQLHELARMIYLLLRAPSSAPQFIVIEINERGIPLWSFATEFTKQLIDFVSGSRVVLYTDHNHSQAHKFAIDHWKQCRRWTWNTETNSRFKYSRRKRDVSSSIPSIVVCTDTNALRTTPWLSTREAATVFYVHDRARKGPLPSWITCLSGVPIVRVPYVPGK